MKTIGILTSGGDCAGLNAIIRSVVYRAIRGYGWKVLGIKNGGHGLMQETPDYIKLDETLCGYGDVLLRLGGTILGTTNKGDPFNFPLPNGTFGDSTKIFIKNYKNLELDALICIGGDGSLKIMRNLAQKGNLNIIGIPKTIDNDIGCTENSIGYLTAVDIATQALDMLQPTAASHDRLMILEVMGRDAGHISLSAGISGGADIILIPEIDYDIHVLAEKIQKTREKGRGFSLAIVAESVKTKEGGAKTVADPVTGKKRFGGIGQYIADELQLLTGAESRVTTLGHVQRGAQPNSRDRLFGTVFGTYAVDLIAQGKFDTMVAWQNRCVLSVPLEDAIAQYQSVNPEGTLIKTARALGICFGDVL